MFKRPRKLTGDAGEYYVAYRLSRLGFPVALTRGGMDTVDVMVASHTSGRAQALQVKTASNARKATYWEWSVGRKPLDLGESQIIFVFVDLNDGDPNAVQPDVFVVPVADVANQAVALNYLENPDWKTFYFKIRDNEAIHYRDQWRHITSKL